MNTDLLELPFPVTILAPDGWATRWSKPEEHRLWSLGAIKKYNRIGFLVADAQGCAWRLLRIEPEKKPTLRDKLRSIFSNCMLSCTSRVEPWPGDPLTAFREQFQRALEKDDDSLTQFHEKDELLKIIRDANSLPTLLRTLHKMRVT